MGGARVRVVSMLLLAALARAAHAEGDLGAQAVTLSAGVGGLSVTGRLFAYDGDVYGIDTVYGPLTLAADGVTCAGASCPDEPTIAVEGDGALADVLMPALLGAFAARRGHTLLHEEAGPGRDVYRVGDGADRLRIVLGRSTSEAGLAALSEGRADAGLSALGLGAAKDGLGDGPGGQRVLALDALVPVVSPRNPVDVLTRDDLAGLLSGEVVDWSAVGGAPGPVALHVLEARGDAAVEAIAASGSDSSPAGVTRHADPRELSRAVARDPGALGLAPSAAMGLAEPVALRGPCGLVSRFDADAARSGDWPLTLPLRLHLPARPLPRLARELIDFATSPAAQGVVHRAGLIDQDPMPIPLAVQGDRLAAAILRAGDEVPLATLQDMTARLSEMTRLTPTFRFERGMLLDAASRDALLRLARRIADGAYDGRKLMLVGFGDGTGSADRNLALSRRRADAVLDAIRARMAGERPDGPALSAEGYGEALPVACDDTAAGRRLNRRVELWVR